MPKQVFRKAGSALVSRLNANRWLTAALGAGLAIALTSLVAHGVISAGPHTPWIVASLGASAVLAFVLPASPLSQPWPVLGGHLIAASVGLATRSAVPEPWLAAGLAVGLAIAAMNLLRCLHPPAGGTALLTALAMPGDPAGHWSYLIMPLGLDVVLLLLCALVWHRLTGHSYPHRTAAVAAPEPWVGHIEDSDLDAVLAEWDETLDISRQDLLALLHAAEARVVSRLSGKAD